VGEDRAGAGQDQLGRSQVGPEVAAQTFDGLAGLLQLESGVEQSLDHLSSRTSP